MASNKITISLNNNIPKIKMELQREFEKAILKSAMRVHRELITTLLVGNRTGKLYKVPGTKRTYRASKPGESPASRLGHLRTSYKYLVKGKGMDAVGYVGSPLPYSHYLEYGTYKMKPRPHLKVAMKNSKKDIEKYFKGLM